MWSDMSVQGMSNSATLACASVIKPLSILEAVAPRSVPDMSCSKRCLAAATPEEDSSAVAMHTSLTILRYQEHVYW